MSTPKQNILKIITLARSKLPYLYLIHEKQLIKASNQKGFTTAAFSDCDKQEAGP